MSFVSPPKEKTDNFRYAPHINKCINLANVTSYFLTRKAWYPDNEGIPCIEFTFIGGTIEEWFFDKEDEKIAKATYHTLKLHGHESRK